MLSPETGTYVRNNRCMQGMPERTVSIVNVLVINGPNLNFLGIRNPGVYGTENYDSLLKKIEKRANELGINVEFFQSNCEGAIIDRIQQAYLEKKDGIIINPGAYTHYSYAIRDALEVIQVPIYEVHISDIHAREAFRAVSVTAEVCTEQIAGLGTDGYLVALERFIK